MALSVATSASLRYRTALALLMASLILSFSRLAENPLGEGASVPRFLSSPTGASITCDQENAGAEQCEARKDYCEHALASVRERSTKRPRRGTRRGALFFGWALRMDGGRAPRGSEDGLA